jgi:outer membrane receptor protein involved in Fe transport
MRNFRFKAATALAMASLFIASGAWAQSDAEEAPKTDTEAGQPVIVVTGTRIPRPEMQGSIPGSQISGEQIQARGFTNILDALNDIPLVGPGASPVGNAGGQPASLGASFVDLLDLGTARTLTPVNGRRFVSGNAGTLFVAANATGSQVDLNSIPTELVARTDVLTVGGAVAYGSDAIAGVVNVILKDDFKGLSFNAPSGVSSRGDLFNYQLAGTAGTGFGGGRGNIAVSLHHSPATRRSSPAAAFRARRLSAGRVFRPTPSRGSRQAAFPPASWRSRSSPRLHPVLSSRRTHLQAISTHWPSTSCRRPGLRRANSLHKTSTRRSTPLLDH